MFNIWLVSFQLFASHLARKQFKSLMCLEITVVKDTRLNQTEQKKKYIYLSISAYGSPVRPQLYQPQLSNAFCHLNFTTWPFQRYVSMFIFDIFLPSVALRYIYAGFLSLRLDPSIKKDGKWECNDTVLGELRRYSDISGLMGDDAFTKCRVDKVGFGRTSKGRIIVICYAFIVIYKLDFFSPTDIL